MDIFSFVLPSGAKYILPGWSDGEDLIWLRRGCCLIIVEGERKYVDGSEVGRLFTKQNTRGCRTLLGDYGRFEILEHFHEVLVKGLRWVVSEWEKIDDRSFDWVDYIGCLNWLYDEWNEMGDLGVQCGERIEELYAIWPEVEILSRLFSRWEMERLYGGDRWSRYIGDSVFFCRCVEKLKKEVAKSGML